MRCLRTMFGSFYEENRPPGGEAKGGGHLLKYFNLSGRTTCLIRPLLSSRNGGMLIIHVTSYIDVYVGRFYPICSFDQMRCPFIQLGISAAVDQSCCAFCKSQLVAPLSNLTVGTVLYCGTCTCTLVQ